MQATIRSLDLDNYRDDFKAVLLNPEQHLRLDQSPMMLDSMGIRREDNGQRKVKRLYLTTCLALTAVTGQ